MHRFPMLLGCLCVFPPPLLSSLLALGEGAGKLAPARAQGRARAGGGEPDGCTDGPGWGPWRNRGVHAGLAGGVERGRERQGPGWHPGCMHPLGNNSTPTGLGGAEPFGERGSPREGPADWGEGEGAELSAHGRPSLGSSSTPVVAGGRADGWMGQRTQGFSGVRGERQGVLTLVFSSLPHLRLGLKLSFLPFYLFIYFCLWHLWKGAGEGRTLAASCELKSWCPQLLLCLS